MTFLAELLAVGSYEWGYNIKTEMYLVEQGRWLTLQNYPYDEESKRA